MSEQPPSPSNLSPTAAAATIGFRFTWTTKITTRKTNDGELLILLVSPKFATVHNHVSFQWNMRMHATTGRLNNELEEETDDVDYVAVELYFIDGPVPQIDINAELSVMDKFASSPLTSTVKEMTAIRAQRGSGSEITDSDRACVSSFLKESVGKPVKLSVLIKMNAKFFEPSFYLDSVSPTPRQSFLTANYNARVNSKVWKKRSKKKPCRNEKSFSVKEKTNYEKKVQVILDQERNAMHELRLRNNSLTESANSRRSSLIDQLKEEKLHRDHDHIFKRILVSCCESCERRRQSNLYDSQTEADSEVEHESGDEEESQFECDSSDKEHVHDLLANLYFNKVVLPEMEYVEDFVDFLIDAELNDLPVLKRSCERYLCGELNTKQDLQTHLLLDLLFIGIVFNLPVMKSMCLSELCNRIAELGNTERLMEQEEYKELDKRMKKIADRSLVELIEQCQEFNIQKSRVQIVQTAPLLDLS